MKKINFLFFFFMLFSSPLFAKEAATFSLDSTQDNVKDDYQYIFRYDAKFAEAHSLSKEYAEKLTPGLIAIERVVSKDRFFKKGTFKQLFPDKEFTEEQEEKFNEVVPVLEVIYRDKKKLPVYYHNDCYFNLYIQNTLKMDYPEEGKEGDRFVSHQVFEEGLEPIKNTLLKQNNNDPTKFNELLKKQSQVIDARFGNKIFIVEKNQLTNTKKYHALPIDNFRKEYYKGIDFIQIGPDKGCLATADTHGEAYLLLKKRDTDKNVDLTKIKSKTDVEKYFYILEVPKALLKFDFKV